MRSTRWLIPASLSALLLGLPGAPSGSTRRDAGVAVLHVRPSEAAGGAAHARDRLAPGRTVSERPVRSANVVPVSRPIRHAVLRAQSPPRS